MNLYSSRHLRISSIILAMKAAHMIHVRRNMFRLFRYTLFPLRPQVKMLRDTDFGNNSVYARVHKLSVWKPSIDMRGSAALLSRAKIIWNLQKV